MPRPTLMAVPNFSEGRDEETLRAIGDALAQGAGVRVLDVHSDADHHRSVFTLAGAQGGIADALASGARAACERIDVVSQDAGARPGRHPHVGAVDVVPVVYLDESTRGAACAEALVVGERIGELDVPVLLYGELTGDGAAGRSRADLRRGGLGGLTERLATGRERPDFGPAQMHPTAGATLVAARPPLVAFNLQLAPPATLAEARAIAARVREGGEDGLPGVRAIGIELAGGVAQVSMNVERPFDVPLAEVVAAVARHAAVAGAELVGLAPRAALADFPAEVALQGFDPARHIIENALGS
jgi:glutamate formiminotransferase/glutamate formiminotransferase/formiminotetrahydrofolate cyclodeaminase